MLEEFGHDGKAADDDAGGELGVGPEAHRDHVVADVRGADDGPGVGGAEDGGDAGACGGVGGKRCVP